MKGLQASLIVLAHGDSGLAERCVESLRTTVDVVKAEIVVFDNASRESDARRLKSLCGAAGARLLRSEKNLGFAAGCNSAADKAEGKVLIFLNNDIEALPGWIEPLLSELEEPEVGIAGSLLLYPNGTVQHAGTGLGLWGLPAHIRRDRLPDHPEVTRSRNVLAVTGACLAICSEHFRQLGGFDERYYFSYEDVDLCLRARRRGWRTRYSPDSRLIHYESATSATGSMQQLRAKAEERFVARWGVVLDRAAGRGLRELAKEGIRKVAIFGTGRAGCHMKRSLEQLTPIEVIGFIDSRPQMAGRKIEGKPVSTPDRPPAGIDAVLGASIFVERLRLIAESAGIGDLFRAAIMPDIEDDSVLQADEDSGS